MRKRFTYQLEGTIGRVAVWGREEGDHAEDRQSGVCGTEVGGIIVGLALGVEEWLQRFV